AFLPRCGDRASLGGLDPQPLEDRLVDRFRIRAWVERELETFQESGRVLGALGDQDELLGRIGNPDLREGPGKLVVAGDVQRELRPSIPETRLAAPSRPTEVGPRGEQMPLARHGSRVEERDERRGFRGDLAEGSDDRRGRRISGASAPGAHGPDRALLGRGKGDHGRGSLPHELEELVKGPGLQRVVLLPLAADRRRGSSAVVVARKNDERVVQRKEPVVEAVVELGGATAGKVGAPALPDEQGVPRGDVPFEDVEDTVLGVPGSVDDVETETAGTDRVPVRYRNVLVDRSDAVRDDLRSGPLLHLLIARHVVGVAVRVENVAHLDAALIDRLEHRVDPEGRVDDDALSAGLLRHEVGEVQIRSDAELVEEHAPLRRERYLTLGERTTRCPAPRRWSGGP